MWKLFMRCSCLTYLPREAGEPMTPTENSWILTFPTFYENHFWLIHAYLNPSDKWESPLYPTKIPGFRLSDFSDFKWKLFLNNSCMISGLWIFQLFRLYTKNIIELFLPDSDFSDFSDFMWKLFLHPSCLAYSLREAGEPMISNGNSGIMTFPTLYENYFWNIPASPGRK